MVVMVVVQSALIAIVGLRWLGGAGVGSASCRVVMRGVLLWVVGLVRLLLRRNHGLCRMALHLASTTIRSTEVEFLYMHGVLVQISDVLAYVACVRLITASSLSCCT